MELAELKQLVESKLNSDERIDFAGHTAGGIICAIAKHLIRTYGYGVSSTILTRELRNLGRRDAEKIVKLFEIKERTPENASKVLKILAFIIGLKSEIKDNRSHISGCPYGDCVKEFDEPFLCNICLEYNRGVVESVAGQGFILERAKRMTDGDEYCEFNIRKR